MSVHLVIFEDESAVHLQPLTLTRPAHDLRVGLLTIRQQWMRALGTRQASGPLRPQLTGVFPASRPPRRKTLWINARYLPAPEIVAAITRRESGHVIQGDDVVAAWADVDETRTWIATGEPRPRGSARRVPTDGLRVLRFPWDVFLHAAAGIRADVEALAWPSGTGPGWSSAACIDRPDRLFMHATAIVEPGAILVADEGPIILDEGSRVLAGAMLRGPLAVGAHATVRMGARIYGGTSIGPHCKVGGEVANVVFHSYTNKAHEGFAGNSVFGQWVNLGADTTASNLKMTYGTVKLLDWPTGLEVDSGEQFIGTIMGDHCKTGINTMLNTGTVCGVSSIVVGAGFPSRGIPSFKWVQPGAVVDYRLDKALVDMERMMSRRGVALDPPYRRMMEAVFAMGRG